MGLSTPHRDSSRPPRSGPRLRARGARRPTIGAGRQTNELEREARMLRRLADQLESLGQQGLPSRTALCRLVAASIREGAEATLAHDVLRAAGRLPQGDAEALLELPRRLKGATRRVRLSAEILTHHLVTMSALLDKAGLMAALTGTSAAP